MTIRPEFHLTPTTKKVRGKRRPVKQRTTAPGVDKTIMTIAVEPEAWDAVKKILGRYPDKAVAPRIISETEVLVVNCPINPGGK